MRRSLFALALSAFAVIAVVAFVPVRQRRVEGNEPCQRGQDARASGLQSAPVDFDFTRMNNTMRMTQIYRLTANPREFEGRTIRVEGVFLFAEEDSETRRFGCLLDGAGGCLCCSPGSVIEFDPPPGLEWPGDFPPPESRIAVEGRLKMVNDGGDPPLAVPRLEATSLVQL